MCDNRSIAARFVGRRWVSADRLGVADHVDEEEQRLAWGPLLIKADDGTGWWIDVEEGRSNILLFRWDDNSAVPAIQEHEVRRPVIDPDGPIGFLLREPIIGVDLIDDPSSESYPFSRTMCGLRLRAASGAVVYIGTHLDDPPIPAAALLCADEVRPDLRCTALAGAGAGIGFDRIEYDSGNENNPGNPFGRTVLAIDALGVARLDNTHVGKHRKWQAVVDPAVLARLTTDLTLSGFPQAPLLRIPAGSSMRCLAVHGKMSGQVMLPWRGAMTVRGYDLAFAALDSLIYQISERALSVAPNILAPSVVHISPYD